MPFIVYLEQSYLPDAELLCKDLNYINQKLMQVCLHKEENGTEKHFWGCFLCYRAERLQSVIMICGCTPLTLHNWAEFDHIRLSFFQIRVENLNRGLPDFQFFAYFMMFLTSSDLRTNHNAVFLVREVRLAVPRLFWFAA